MWYDVLLQTRVYYSYFLDGNIFLAVKLHGEGVILETAQILDMDGNVIKNVTLKLVDEKSKFYLTEEFDPPKTKFLLSVSTIFDVYDTFV